MIFRLLFIALLIFAAVYSLLWASFYKGFLTRQRLKTINRVFTVGTFTVILSVIVFCFITSTEL